MNRPSLLVLVTLALFGACAADWDRHDRGPVRPDPPGPIDGLRMLFGDNSSRCPDHYEYCSWKICCPLERGCCHDSRGSYCCASRGYGGDYDYRGSDEGDRGDVYYERRERTETTRSYGCNPGDTECVQGGRTVCCPGSAHCCAGSDGPQCCSDNDDWRRGGDDWRRDDDAGY